MYIDNGQSGHFTVTFSAYAQNYSGQGVWLQLSHSGKDVFNNNIDINTLSSSKFYFQFKRFLKASGGAKYLRKPWLVKVTIII